MRVVNWNEMVGKWHGRLMPFRWSRQEFGNLGRKRVILDCLCECGTIHSVDGTHLRRKKIRSCGCLRDELTSQREVLNLEGKIFGRLTVLADIGKRYGPGGSIGQQVIWPCECSCGRYTEVIGSQLTGGRVVSCGCFNRENFKKNVQHLGWEAVTIHGEAHTRLGKLHNGMKQRCYNENASNYALYGGRGISICDEWHDFLVFKAWALENEYDDTLCIDRINRNGDYEPNNCQWITREENGRKVWWDRGYRFFF